MVKAMHTINENALEQAMSEILGRYKKDVENIYSSQVEQLKIAIAEDSDKNRVLKILNARLSGAGRRARVDLMVFCLSDLKAKLDITITVAAHSIFRTMGRKIKNETLIHAFGSPGRTAAEKSTVTAEDLALAEQQMKNALVLLVDSMTTMRRAVSSTIDFPSKSKS